MKITVAQEDKEDTSFHKKLYVSIFEDDYNKIENLRTPYYPLIDNYPALVRFEFNKSSLIISLRRKVPTDRFTIRMHVKCEMLDFSRTLVCPSLSWSDWISMGKIPREEACSSNGRIHYFEVNLNLCELRNKTYLNLYEDKYFSDVFLTCDSDGDVPASVAMHRPVLCAHSRMLKSWLLGDWRHETEISIKIKEANYQTLLNLKQYIYLGILPNKNLLDLLHIAREYCFDDLVTDCMFELVNVVNSDTLLEYRQFGIDNDLPQLLEALQHITEKELVKTTRKLQLLKICQAQDQINAKKNWKSLTKLSATKDTKSSTLKDTRLTTLKDTKSSTSKDTRASTSKNTRASTSKTKDTRPLKYQKEKSSIFDR